MKRFVVCLALLMGTCYGQCPGTPNLVVNPQVVQPPPGSKFDITKVVVSFIVTNQNVAGCPDVVYTVYANAATFGSKAGWDFLLNGAVVSSSNGLPGTITLPSGLTANLEWHLHYSGKVSGIFYPVACVAWDNANDCSQLTVFVK